MKKVIYVVLWLALLGGCWALNAHKQAQLAEARQAAEALETQVKEIEGGGGIQASEEARSTIRNLIEWKKLKAWYDTRRKAQLTSLREGKLEWAGF